MTAKTARESAEALFQELLRLQNSSRVERLWNGYVQGVVPFKEAIERALISYGNQKIEEAAKVAEEQDSELCRRCEGEGSLWEDGKAHSPNFKGPTKPCPYCDGDGRVEKNIPFEIRALKESTEEKV